MTPRLTRKRRHAQAFPDADDVMDQPPAEDEPDKVDDAADANEKEQEIWDAFKEEQYEGAQADISRRVACFRLMSTLHPKRSAGAASAVAASILHPDERVRSASTRYVFQPTGARACSDT